MKGGESMKYILIDRYDCIDEFGEEICISDSMEEIKQAARLHREETCGNCDLFVVSRVDEKENA